MEQLRRPGVDAFTDPTIPGVDEEWEDRTKGELHRALLYVELSAIGSVEHPDAATSRSPEARVMRGLQRDDRSVTTLALIRCVRGLLDDRISIAEVERQVLRVVRDAATPQIDDAEVRGAYRRASEMIEQLTMLRAELADEDTTKGRLVEAVNVVNAAHLALGGSAQLSEGTRDKLIRAEVINCFEYVAQLRLPEVLAELGAAGKLELDRTTRLLGPLMADATAVRALVALRWPEVAGKIDDEVIGKIIDSIRDDGEGGSKWDAIADLFERIALYTPKDERGGSGADTVRTQHARSKRGLRPDVFLRENRLRIWTRLAEFFTATGLGEFTAEDAERIWRDRSAR